MAKDSYSEITEYFGIPTVEQLITNRHDRFLNRYRCQEHYVCMSSTDYVVKFSAYYFLVLLFMISFIHHKW